MRRNRISFYLLLSLVLVFTSCLKDDETTTVYPSDAAITSFTLGTMKQYITTKSKSGADSTYSKTFAGSTYKFYIDQVNHTIYNPDSLPYGTYVKNVLCTVGSKNSGTVVIQKINSDTLLYYNSSDSIDLSVPRTFKVISLDGSTVATYSVNVNVHKEIPDTFLWGNITANQDFAEAKAMKALSCNGKVFVAVSNDHHSGIFCTDETDGAQWTPVGWNVNTPFPTDAYKNIVATDSHLYLYHAGIILRTADGNQWEQVAQVTLGQLIAACGSTLYAYDVQGQLVASRDNGATWNVETLDTPNVMLPTQDLSYTILASPVNSETKTIVLTGNRSPLSFPDDDSAVVWFKVMESDTDDSPWMSVTSNDQKHLNLPRLASLQTVALGKDILATGADGIGACTTQGFSHLYRSDNGGIYWRPATTGYCLPSGFASGSAFAMTTDSQHRIWMICSGNGYVWRGYRTTATSNTVHAITQ